MDVGLPVGDYARQSLLRREVDHRGACQRIEQAAGLHVQQQVAFAVMGTAARTFEVVHVAANDR
ncbi:hypothetical protein [Thermomonas sp.]|uniref:hypothetical protein n=1 Tax=Thermomonas sp. TaxID=1971895 RepID=UPI00391C2280